MNVKAGSSWSQSDFDYIYRVARSSGEIPGPAYRLVEEAFKRRPDETELSFIVYPTVPTIEELLRLHLKDPDLVPGWFYGLERIPITQIRPDLRWERDGEHHVSVYVAETYEDQANQDAIDLKDAAESCWHCTRADVRQVRRALCLPV